MFKETSFAFQLLKFCYPNILCQTVLQESLNSVSHHSSSQKLLQFFVLLHCPTKSRLTVKKIDSMADSFINHRLEQYMWKQSELHSLTVLISFMFICKNTECDPQYSSYCPCSGQLLLHGLQLQDLCCSKNILDFSEHGHGLYNTGYQGGITSHMNRKG